MLCKKLPSKSAGKPEGLSPGAPGGSPAPSKSPSPALCNSAPPVTVSYPTLPAAGCCLAHTCAPYGFTSAWSLTESKNIKPGPSVGQLMNADVLWISEATGSQSKLLEAAPAARFPPSAHPRRPQEPSSPNNPSSGRDWLLPTPTGEHPGARRTKSLTHQLRGGDPQGQPGPLP